MSGQFYFLFVLVQLFLSFLVVSKVYAKKGKEILPRRGQRTSRSPFPLFFRSMDSWRERNKVLSWCSLTAGSGSSTAAAGALWTSAVLEHCLEWFRSQTDIQGGVPLHKHKSGWVIMPSPVSSSLWRKTRKIWSWTAIWLCCAKGVNYQLCSLTESTAACLECGK